jgi:hypothetical protein
MMSPRTRLPVCRWTPLLGLGAVLCGLPSCRGDSDSRDVQRTDSAGVEIVLSSGPDRALAWEFDRLFALGGSEEGPESFFRVGAGLVDADGSGNLFILDPQNARVVVFDTAGRFVRSMGAGGGGPGEFRTPASLSVSPDGAVAVFDYGKGGLVRFDATGAVDDEQPFALFPTPDGQRHFSQFSDTTLVSSSTSPMEPGGLTQMLRQIVDADTLVLSQLPLPAVQMAMYEKCRVGLMLPPIFAPELTWAPGPGVVALGTTTEYSISLVQAGNVTRIVRRQIAPMPASRDRAIHHLGEGIRIGLSRGSCLIDPAEMVDKRGVAEVIPLIGRIFLSPSGELWVQRFAIGRDGVAAIDVFNRRGGYVGTIAQDRLTPVVLLPGDRVGVVETDEVDVQRLAVLAIRR